MVRLEPPNSITNCDCLTKKFLSRFFIPKKNAKLRGEIIKFSQKHGEDMSQAWIRFKQMLNAFPHYMKSNEVIAHTFIDVLEYIVRGLFYNATCIQYLSITSEVLFELLDKLSKGTKGIRGKYLEPQNQKVFGILNVEQDTALNAKIDKCIRYS